MGLKKFFKPTKSKVLLGILIFTIFPFKSSACYGFGKCGGWIPFGGLMHSWGFIHWTGTWLFKGYTISNYPLSMLPSIILMLFFSYLISCLIIFIYNKLRKK